MTTIQQHPNEPIRSASTVTDDGDDVLLDLDCEGLDGLKVEWLPRQDIHGRIFSGGRYVFEIESDGRSVTVWATPDQMQDIRRAIEEGVAGDPPRQEMLDWIDRYWTYMSIHVDADYRDEEERACYQARLQEATEAWEGVVASDDCQEPLPETHCRELGITPGTTFGQACTCINNRIDTAWDEQCRGAKRHCKYPGFTVRQRRDGWIVREYRGRVVATCPDMDVAEKVAAALSSSRSG